jgi:hypothetical protein
MDRLSRTDSRYLQLFTNEHEYLKTELELLSEYKLKEDAERDLFFVLSAALRDSQEKERSRAERVKYIQLGISVSCTVIGLLTAYIVSYFRNSNIREILVYEREQFTQTNQLLNQLLINQNDFNKQLSLQQAKLDQLENKSSDTANNFQIITEPDAVTENLITEPDAVTENVITEPDVVAENVITDDGIGKDNTQTSYPIESPLLTKVLLSTSILLGILIYSNK